MNECTVGVFTNAAAHGSRRRRTGRAAAPLYLSLSLSPFAPPHPTPPPALQHRLQRALSLSTPYSIEFRAVGIVMGLAIYNGVLLDVRFPTVSAGMRVHACSPARAPADDAGPQCVLVSVHAWVLRKPLRAAAPCQEGSQCLAAVPRLYACMQVLYKKLLGGSCSLADLQDLDPVMAGSLRQLLDMDDVSIMCL